MNDDRKFKGVWIPREIWLDPALTIHEKVMLVEIDSLDNENGCYARNQHFCEFLGVTERRVQTLIKGLKDKGLIDVTLLREAGNKEIKGRVINITRKCALFSDSEVVNKTAGGGEQSFVEVVNKASFGGEQKCAVSNTRLSNTLLSNTSKGAQAKPADSSPVFPDTFSPQLAEKVKDWVQYKKERREGYKETGLKSLITEIRHNAERYGEQPVIDLITSCMAAGYKGIIFDKLKNSAQSAQRQYAPPPQKSSNPFLEMLREEEARNGQK